VPTYQYACTDCEHRFEAVQAFTEDSLSTCPECGGRLRKVYGSVGVVFKGSGFYRTDSRAASSDISAAKGSEGSEKSEKSEKSGAADKPAAKGEKSGERKSAGSGSGSTGGSSGSGSGSSNGSASGGSSSSSSGSTASGGSGGGSGGGNKAAAR
jgi:putative FmdB family regulatory protein